MLKRRDERGQVIAIYAISLLLISFMTILTLAVGVRVREKIKVETAADSSAYGLAVGQARMMNTMALANRAIVAEYVSMLSVIGHESFLNEWVTTIKDQETVWDEIGAEYSGECAICWLVECFCPACECISTIFNDIHGIWASDGFTEGSGCPSGSGGIGSYECSDGLWHTGSGAKLLHGVLTAMDNGYILQAANARLQGTNAHTQYMDMVATQSFGQALGQGIDPNIVKDATASPASLLQMHNAVQDYPADPGLASIADADWDSYHEILTGTRTDWILNHDFAGGFFWLDVAAEELKALECGAYVAVSDASDSGGAMVMKGAPSDVISKNHNANAHSYQEGDAKGEGGRRAGSAEDHGYTDGAMAGGGCAVGGGYSSDGLGVGDNYQFQDPHAGCASDTTHKAGDGHSDGDNNASGVEYTWSIPYNSIGAGVCSGAGPGIVVGWFRFAIANDATEGVLFNQPRAYASLKIPVADPTKPRMPWDFNIDGTIGGSLLTVDASKDQTGASPTSAREAGSTAGRAYSTQTFPFVHGFSTGLTYYHNPLDWREVPNLWNPFWRAKLDRPFKSSTDLLLVAGGSPDDLAIQKLISTSGTSMTTIGAAP